MSINAPYLPGIFSPEELRALPTQALPELADELRTFLLESVSKTGGHLASNLGCVELAIALHYVYQTPEDHLIWDVGHQSYPHKILTERKDKMNTIRQHGGLSGFPKREESAYDAFGVGHSSTSIGAALGMAVADKLQGQENRSVAIIGDGAMTAGQAFEALNNAGAMKDVNLLVILNDNDMAISPNVGAFPQYLAKSFARDLFSAVKHGSGKVLGKVMPPALDIAHKVEDKIKSMVSQATTTSQETLFEEFGFTYTGPIDGHDIELLVETLEDMKKRRGPQFLHIITQKGRGYEQAEKNPTAYHGVPKFDVQNGLCTQNSASMTYSEVFGRWMIDQAKVCPKLIGITPAMREGSGLIEFADHFPERYFDVGIAEQHAVTFAAGLACQGLKPVVAIYSTFLQRAYDQLVHDVALQNLPVLFAIDRAGLVGADGPTHAGAFDLSFLSCIPNMVIAAPSDEQECYRLLSTCYQLNQPTAVRYPRGCGCGADLPLSTNETVEVGKGIVRHEGEKTAILAFGSMVAPALQAAQTLNATVVDMRFVKPLDEELIKTLTKTHSYIVTVEENAIIGGAGSIVTQLVNTLPSPCPVLNLGLPDQYIAHGDHGKMLSALGLDDSGLVTQISDWQKILTSRT